MQQVTRVRRQSALGRFYWTRGLYVANSYSDHQRSLILEQMSYERTLSTLAQNPRTIVPMNVLIGHAIEDYGTDASDLKLQNEPSHQFLRTE